MRSRKVLVTGSSGLIGSTAVRLFDKFGYQVHGIDNNLRERFFGPDGNTNSNLERLKEDTRAFLHHDLDIRDAPAIERCIRDIKPDYVLHCAAQPAHEYARIHPVVDFHVNVTGTLNLLEGCRKHMPDVPFLFCSSSKVYGPINNIPHVEYSSRFDFSLTRHNSDLSNSNRLDGWSFEGVKETFPLEPGAGRGIYGSGKASADLLVQEYGLSYGMPTVSFRGNCMTGPSHSAAEPQGFLPYLARCLREERTYTIFGYAGKQVRDNIHSFDYVTAMYMVCLSPPKPGMVYNIGGGRKNSCSILEAIDALESIAGRRLNTTYLEKNRAGDHRIYMSDTSKFRKDYPGWGLKWSLQEIYEDLMRGLNHRH
ncbi:MAG: NAD-dependent epimerase/dehydratase family protein [Deltaproteobacteria bacterium]